MHMWSVGSPENPAHSAPFPCHGPQDKRVVASWLLETLTLRHWLDGNSKRNITNVNLPELLSPLLCR